MIAAEVVVGITGTFKRPDTTPSTWLERLLGADDLDSETLRTQIGP